MYLIRCFLRNHVPQSGMYSRRVTGHRSARKVADTDGKVTTYATLASSGARKLTTGYRPMTGTLNLILRPTTKLKEIDT